MRTFLTTSGVGLISSDQIDEEVDDAILEIIPEVSPTCRVDFTLVIKDGTCGTLMLVHFALNCHPTKCRRLELSEQEDAYMRNQSVHRLLVSEPKRLQ